MYDSDGARVVVRKRSIKHVEFLATVKIDKERFHPHEQVSPHHRRWSRELCLFLQEQGVATIHYW